MKDELFTIKGRTIGYIKSKDGSIRKVFDKENTIGTGLKEIARDMLTAANSGAAEGKVYGKRDLFSAPCDNNVGGAGAGFDGEDGIMLSYGGVQYFMEMTGHDGGDYHPSDTDGDYYIQVRGSFAYDDYIGHSALATDQNFDAAKFGTNFDIDANAENDGAFINEYASQSLTGVQISTGDTFILDWKITIS